jgi:hypothetical protein
MASKPTFRESLIYSPFNNRTPLLAKEYFIEFNTFVCLIIVVTFRRLFFFFFCGGRGKYRIKFQSHARAEGDLVELKHLKSFSLILLWFHTGTSWLELCLNPRSEQYSYQRHVPHISSRTYQFPLSQRVRVYFPQGTAVGTPTA